MVDLRIAAIAGAIAFAALVGGEGGSEPPAALAAPIATPPPGSAQPLAQPTPTNPVQYIATPGSIGSSAQINSNFFKIYSDLSTVINALNGCGYIPGAAIGSITTVSPLNISISNCSAGTGTGATATLSLGGVVPIANLPSNVAYLNPSSGLSFSINSAQAAGNNQLTVGVDGAGVASFLAQNTAGFRFGNATGGSNYLQMNAAGAQFSGVLSANYGLALAINSSYAAPTNGLAIGVDGAGTSTFFSDNSAGFRFGSGNGGSNYLQLAQASALFSGALRTAYGYQASAGATQSLADDAAGGWNMGVTSSATYGFRFWKGTVGGNYAPLFASAFTVTSDRRLKRRIRPSRYGLAAVVRLRPVTYMLIGDRRQSLGFVAQDVLPVIPQTVTRMDAAGHLGVNYDALIPVLVRAIQEQQAEIRELRRRR